MNETNLKCSFRSGLIRATNNQGNRAAIYSIGSEPIDFNNRQMSDNSMTTETVEVEKLQIDNSITEKQTMMVPAYSHLSKSPSVTSNSITVSSTTKMKSTFNCNVYY